MRRALNERAENQGHYFNAHLPGKRLTPAGPDHAQIAAMSGIADYLDALYTRHFRTNLAADGRVRRVNDLMRDHEVALMKPLLDFLAGRNDLRLIGPREAERRAPTISVLNDRPGEALAADLSLHKIMAGGGDFYGRRPVEALGIDPRHGVLRLSFLHYTSPQEIDQVIEALDRVL
ncbi:MAG: hypothetical protein GTN90_06475 [Xanthomonadales bacterium]|nr:hypothetical protein [Xanthomonadales bacterium]